MIRQVRYTQFGSEGPSSILKRKVPNQMKYILWNALMPGFAAVCAIQVTELQQELAAVAADRDQLRSEVERVSSDCAAAKKRLASAEGIKAGLEVSLSQVCNLPSPSVQVQSSLHISHEPQQRKVSSLQCCVLAQQPSCAQLAIGCRQSCGKSIIV